MKAELVSDPICVVDEKAGLVKAFFSFKAVQPSGDLVELSWEEGEPRENGKKAGGTSRCVVEDDTVPFVCELSIPVDLFLKGARLKLRLRTFDPIYEIGYGKARLTGRADDPSQSLSFVVTGWTDHS